MSCPVEETFNIVLVKGGSYSRLLKFEDEDETPVNLSDVVPVMLVKFGGSSSFEWTTPQLTVTDAGAGEINIEISKANIDALTFKNGRYYVFFEINGVRGEEVLSGTIAVK